MITKQTPHITAPRRDMNCRCPIRRAGADGQVDVVLCYPPSRLARKFAYRALPIDDLYPDRHLVELIKALSAAAPKTS